MAQGGGEGGEAGLRPHLAGASHVKTLKCQVRMNFFNPLLLGVVVRGCQKARQSCGTATVSPGGLLSRSQTSTGWAFRLHYGKQTEVPSEFSQHSPGKERKYLPPLLQVTGNTPNACLFTPPWPDPRYLHGTQFRGGRESTSEQGHSRHNQRQSQAWALEALPPNYLGLHPDKLQTGC